MRQVNYQPTPTDSICIKLTKAKNPRTNNRHYPVKFRFRRPTVPSTFEVKRYKSRQCQDLTVDQQEQSGTQHIVSECASPAFQLLHSFRQAGKYKKKVGDDSDCHTHLFIHLTTELCAKK